MTFALSYVFLAITSSCWSVDGAITRKRLVVFLINAVFIYALARVGSMLEIALLGFVCTGAVGLISLGIDIFVQHTFAPLDPDYRFMGVMTANFQAMNLLVCLLCGLTLAQRRPQVLRWMSPLLLLFTFLLFITRARVGTFLCLGMMVFVLLRLAKQHLEPLMRALTMIVVLTVLVPMGVFAIGRSGGGALTDVFMMGRKDTQNTASLSNRAPLWAELMQSVDQRPLLGFGFEAFWSPERVERISFDQGWMVPHAHNTYLDQMLSLGAVGSFLFASTLIGGCVVAWRRYRRRPDESSLLPALLLTWLAILSLTESTPVSPYLPTLIAYSCLVKLCMVEGSEAEWDTQISAGDIFSPLPAHLTAGSGLQEAHS
ncbi:MAG: O-antigen ligase family protein [Janthinobacterium lividum]